MVVAPTGEGKLLRMTPAGDVKPFADIDARIVWALAVEGDAVIAAGGAEKGAVLVQAREGSSRRLAELARDHGIESFDAAGDITPETWDRILAALPVGGRFAAMLFGDRDQSAADASMTCPSPAEIRARLGSFEIEHWDDREEDTRTALGEPHHFHLVELVARRVAPG